MQNFTVCENSGITMNDYEYRFRFLGYGSPESPLWFVGIEEGGDMKDPPARKAHKKFELGSDTYFRDPGLPSVDRKPVWRKYQDISCNAGNGNSYFISNVAPLARINIKKSLDLVDYKVYTKRVKDERVSALRKLVEKYHPRAVIFHGVNGWRNYRVMEAFGLISQGQRVNSYSTHHFMFTGFLSRGQWFSREDQNTVIDTLKSWLELPS